MAKITEGEKLILEKLEAIEGPISSDDLGDLTPKTTREHLLVMLPVHASMLQRLENIEKTLNDGLVEKVARLETTWKVGGAVILTALVALAMKVIFG